VYLFNPYTKKIAGKKMQCLYRHKYQLVEWFHQRTNEPLHKVKKRSKKQLYWLFYNSAIVNQIKEQYS